jgi:hypothetical protein
MTVEVDGQWGPYLECNPLDVKDPLGGWNCTNGLSPPLPKNYPKQCSAGNFTFVNRGYCFEESILHKPKFTFENVDLSDCCD